MAPLPVCHAALVAALGLLVACSAPSSARAAPPESDYAFAQFGVGAEYLLADFYARAVASKRFGGVELRALRRARFNAREHVEALGRILTGGGQPLAAAEDFTFAYPGGTFGSRTSIAKAGLAIERTVLGAYLGAALSVTEPSFREVFVRAAANAAEHVSVLSRIAFGRAVGNSFPHPVSLEAASDALDGYFGF